MPVGCGRKRCASGHRQFSCTRRPIGRILRQPLPNDGVQSRGHPGCGRGGGRRWEMEMCVDVEAQIVSAGRREEWRGAGQGRVKDAGQCVDIAAPIAVPAESLRGHVGERAQLTTCRRDLGAVGGTRDSEVDEIGEVLSVTPRVDEDVGRLDVAVQKVSVVRSV